MAGDLISIGISGLRAQQTALAITGNNISNVNTEGYSRQRVDFSTRPAQETGAGFIGAGVNTTGVSRVINEFLQDQLLADSSRFFEFDTFNANTAQLDNLLGDPDSGLSTSLNSFFEGLQAATNDPSSVPARQVFLSNSENLSDRFNLIWDQLDSLNDNVNAQMESLTAQVTALADGIAELNVAISNSAGRNAGQLPNDLLDERDQALKDLSELVKVSVVNQDNLSVNVFIGSGVPLVIGALPSVMSIQNSDTDPTRKDVTVTSSSGIGTVQVVTSQVSGGQLGGLIDYRDQILDPIFNELGRIALAVADSMNAQHQLGMDLDGDLGGNYFQDINERETTLGRVIADGDNAAPADRVISATISDIGALTDSDYTISFSGPTSNDYVIKRVNDDVNVVRGSLSGNFPDTITFDGIDMSFEAGTFQTGDRFLVVPTRFAARDMALQINSVRDIALAAPIRTGTNSSNAGTGEIDQGVMLDATTSNFTTTTGQLSSPITIVFTSATTYDVLDNTDPANPVNLTPPLVNQIFVPGENNGIFTTDSGEIGKTSDGTNIGALNPVATNGYSAESYTVTTTDPDTGVISIQNTSTSANDSAQTIAASLNALTGVTATARSEASLSSFSTDLPATLTVTLNGEALVASDSDTLAANINSNSVLAAQGITATSDGSTLTVTSTTGVDLSFDIASVSGTETVDITGPAGTVTANDTDTYTVGGEVDMFMEGGAVLSTGSSNIFNQATAFVSTYPGYQVNISGQPEAGDSFTVEFNTDGFSDNRNGLAMLALQSANLLEGSATYGESYGVMVEKVGNATSQSALNRASSEALLQQSEEEREALSGVNLDEEAANLVKFEQAYNASAQVIAVARTIFDALLRSVGG
mgnify:CR=1 FL=1